MTGRSHSEAKLEVTGTTLEIFFSYNPEDGLFTHKTWRGPRGGGPGSIAGSKMLEGYILIGLPGGGKVLAHRLAWLWMHGKWPTLEIDHINGDRTDNRIANLREATRTQQAWNGGRRRNNKSGRVGVFFDKWRGQWVSVMQSGKTSHRKRFDTLEAAIEDRAGAERRIAGEFAPTPRESWRA